MQAHGNGFANLNRRRPLATQELFMVVDRIPEIVAIVGGLIMKKKEITLLASGESLKRFRRASLVN